jgi:hypothetical protein
LNLDGTISPSSFSGNQSINFNNFNLDFILSWQFSAGSYLTFSWKNSIFQSDNLSQQTFFDNLSKTFNTPASNEFSLKLIYYIDYLIAKSFLTGKK